MYLKRSWWLSLGVCLWQVTAGLPSGQAASSNASSGALDVNFFYDNLKDQGSWFNTTDYGDVWQPYIAYKSDTWRPYTDGYWTYTDGGWMFVSYEDFGWAVYHYGRWTQLKDIGWAWVPGTEWAPAWVTWRESKQEGGEGKPPAGDSAPPAANVAATTTDAGANNNPPPAPAPQGEPSSGGSVSQNYIGWAPLPPDPGPPVYDASFAYGPTVDVDYGIDPYDYCFTDVRYFGAPFIGGVIFDPFRNYECCERSVNVTNFYYNNRGGYRGFYNGGPRYERFNGVTERPIPRYNLHQQQGRLAQQAVRSGQFNQIKGNTLNVAAPRFSRKNVNNGRVNFANRGALPVTQVNRERPANAANNEVRQRAQSTFRQQGEAFRAQNPNAPGTRRGAPPAPGGADQPGIATTPRAQQEERQARAAARREGPAQNPNEGPGREPQPAQGAGGAENPAAKAENRQTRTEARAARQTTGRSRRGSGEGRSRRTASTAVAREPRSGGGGAERAFGGGGGRGRASRGGGGGGGGMHLGGGGGGGGGRSHGGGGGGGGGGGRGHGGGGGGGGGGGHKGGGGGGKKQ